MNGKNIQIMPGDFDIQGDAVVDGGRALPTF
jgi:hypothetical protein